MTMAFSYKVELSEKKLQKKTDKQVNVYPLTKNIFMRKRVLQPVVLYHKYYH